MTGVQTCALPISFNFSGVLTSPWEAEEMKKTPASTPAFYGTSYYQAPDRNFDYNEKFLTDYAPGTPGVFAIRREDFQDLTHVPEEGNA